MSFPSPTAGGAASLLGGFLEGYLGSKTRQAEFEYAQREREKEQARVIAEREAAEERERQKRQAESAANVQEGTQLFRSLLDPSVKPEEAILQLSAFDQTKGTRFTPLYGEFAKARTQVPFTEDEEGNQIRNPYYVNQWEPVSEFIPDLKGNTAYEYKYDYDFKTGEYRTDVKGQKRPKDINRLGALFVQKKGSTATGGQPVFGEITDEHQKLLNDLAAKYIEAQSQNNAALKLSEQGMLDSDAQDVIRRNAEGRKLTLENWVDQVLPSTDNAGTYINGLLKKLPQGQKPDPVRLWSAVIKRYEEGVFNSTDVQLLALKFLTMYGRWPVNYLPGVKKTPGEVIPEEEEE